MAYLSFSRLSLPFSLTRHVWFPLTLLISVLVMSAGLLWIKGVRWGVDFKGGMVVEASFPHKLNLEKVRHIAEKKFGKETTVQESHEKGKFTVFIRTPNIKHNLDDAQKQFSNHLKTKVVFEKYDIVGAKLGSALMESSMWALLCAFLGVGAYIWIRFDWIFCIASWVTLLYDCATLSLFYVLFRYEVGEGAMVAFLITIGYSINDTVIIFDRIRENRGYKKSLVLGEIIDLSIQGTLSRTILTSATTLVALAVLYYFGGNVIASYSLPMIVGIASGTISSIVISAPLVYILSHFTKAKKIT